MSDTDLLAQVFYYGVYVEVNTPIKEMKTYEKPDQFDDEDCYVFDECYDYGDWDLIEVNDQVYMVLVSTSCDGRVACQKFMDEMDKDCVEIKYSDAINYLYHDKDFERQNYWLELMERGAFGDIDYRIGFGCLFFEDYDYRD